MSKKPRPAQTPPAGRRKTAAPKPQPLAPYAVANARSPRCNGPVFFFPAGCVVLCRACPPVRVG